MLVLLEMFLLVLVRGRFFGAIERVGSEKGVILIITNCESHRAQRDELPVLRREDGEKVVKAYSIDRREMSVVNSRFDGCM